MIYDAISRMKQSFNDMKDQHGTNNSKSDKTHECDGDTHCVSMEYFNTYFVGNLSDLFISC